MPLPSQPKLTARHMQLLRRTLDAVDNLLEHTAKDGPIYQSNPQKVADVNRAGASLRRALRTVIQLAEREGTRG